jgi:parallel beta-helix repeat protein
VGVADGFRVTSADNRLMKNRAQGHFVGIQVSGERNTLSGNQASGTGNAVFTLDAADNHPDCDEHTWKGNLFHVASPACVE